jgi:hypothetical protein
MRNTIEGRKVAGRHKKALAPIAHNQASNRWVEIITDPYDQIVQSSDVFATLPTDWHPKHMRKE